MNDYSPPLGEFQPPDPVEDRGAMLEDWIERKMQHGFAVLTREELNARLDEHATDAYSEGRSDQGADDAARIAHLEGQRGVLVSALSRLLNSDPDGSIANASEDELCFAANDAHADPVVREQAGAILEARAALAAISAEKAGEV